MKQTATETLLQKEEVTNEFRITGMNCNGCETIIEEVVGKLEGVAYVKADYIKSTVKVTYNTNKTNLVHIQKACFAAGYPFELSPSSKKQKDSKIALSVLALIGLAIAIILARNIGHRLILPEVNSNTSAVMIFMVGLLTGLHCIGMCGSFIIGFTTKDVEQNRSIIRSHVLYGIGKTLSYAMLGAMFGFAGSLFRITPLVSGISLSLAGTFLILYGLNMLNILSVLKYFRVKQPKFITRFTAEKKRQTNSPFYIGFFSGFIIGCGPLQVMYVLAAGNGSAIEGAKFLTIFGLGTLPALFGFGVLARLLSNTMTRRFIQASGIILIVLGSIMLNKGIVKTSSIDNSKVIPSCCHGEK